MSESALLSHFSPVSGVILHAMNSTLYCKVSIINKELNFLIYFNIEFYCRRTAATSWNCYLLLLLEHVWCYEGFVCATWLVPFSFTVMHAVNDIYMHNFILITALVLRLKPKSRIERTYLVFYSECNLFVLQTLTAMC